MTSPEKEKTPAAPASQTTTNDAGKETSVSYKDYIVLDLQMYLLGEEDNKGRRKTYKFHKGQTVQLSDAVAKNLLREPRPSVILKADVKDN